VALQWCVWGTTIFIYFNPGQQIAILHTPK
jgi:hypothetical protein